MSIWRTSGFCERRKQQQQQQQQQDLTTATNQSTISNTNTVINNCQCSQQLVLNPTPILSSIFPCVSVGKDHYYLLILTGSIGQDRTLPILIVEIIYNVPARIDTILVKMLVKI